MADVADEVAPHGLQPVEMAQVLQEDGIAARLATEKGRHAEAQMEPAVEFDGKRLAFLVQQAQLPRVGDAVVAHDLDQGLVQRLLHGNAQQACGCWVHANDSAMGIEHEHPVAHRVEHGLEPVVFVRAAQFLAFHAVGQQVDRALELAQIIGADVPIARRTFARGEAAHHRCQALDPPGAHPMKGQEEGGQEHNTGQQQHDEGRPAHHACRRHPQRQDQGGNHQGAEASKPQRPPPHPALVAPEVSQ